jgi:hypothetical protein
MESLRTFLVSLAGTGGGNNGQVQKRKASVDAAEGVVSAGIFW